MSAPRLTATGRVQRLLAILQWAAARTDGVPVAELCERFRISPAEVVRELDLASMIGADALHYDEMPFEVFIEDGLVYVRLFSFRRPMRLTPAEGLALVAAADVLVDRDAAQGDPGPLERALDKLATLLGIEPGQTIDIDLDPDGGPIGQAIRRAIAADRQIEFTYWTYGRDVVRRRVVDPWDLFADQGAWYLAGWAHDPGAARNFRLDRMEELHELQVQRSTPAPRSVDRRVRITDDAPHVVLDLGPGARWVAEAHPVLDARLVGDDRLRVTLAVTGASWLERLLVRLGPEASVVSLDPDLGPADLGPAAARRVLERYQGRTGLPPAAR